MCGLCQFFAQDSQLTRKEMLFILWKPGAISSVQFGAFLILTKTVVFLKNAHTLVVVEEENAAFSRK